MNIVSFFSFLWKTQAHSLPQFPSLPTESNTTTRLGIIVFFLSRLVISRELHYSGSDLLADGGDATAAAMRFSSFLPTNSTTTLASSQ